MQEREGLKEQAYRDLGNSGIPLLMLYPVLALMIGLASDLWVEHREVVYAEVLATIVLGLIRHRWALLLKTAPGADLPRHRKWYCALTLVLAVCWSSFNAWTIFMYGRSWTGLLVLMVSLGLVAGATSNLVWNYAVMLAYMLTMMLPGTLAMASHGDTPARLTAVMMLVYTYFLALIGNRHANRFWSLSYALQDLHQSRLQEGEMLSRWRSLVENAPDTILLVNREKRIEFINRSEGNYQPAEVLGKPFDYFLTQELKAEVESHYNQVFETGEPVSYEIEARSPDGRSLGWYSCRMGPLIRQGQVEAVVVIASDVTLRHQMEQEILHSREQLRRLANHQQAALEEERRHMSREIHDELGQQLTALKIDLAWLERRLEDTPLIEKVEEMGQLVTNTIATVRRISSRLRPPLLDELGLAPALDWLVQDICGRAGLKYQLDINLGGLVPDEEFTLAIFRICQEGLTNVVRHAQAGRVELEVRRDGDELEVCVCDDGVGIVAEKVRTSLGLLGLQERVQGLGGRVSIVGTPGQGSEVRCRFPLRGENH
ncbi:MAG: PAS domain-containing protein [Candidatus Eremiobacteraeota bacterium]|nr:PAS domain-containing protein [Candidatus Eremiobacteraeota bacterium]